MKSAKNIEQSIKKLAVESSDRIHDRILDKLLRTLDKSKRQTTAEQANIWRIIMKSRVSKIAAAAVIIIAILTSIHFWGSPIEGIAWADVVHPILTAHTVVFHARSIEGENLPITRIMNMGTQRVRSEVLSADGKTVQVIAICDFDTSQALTLIPKQKIATVVDIEGLPEKPENFVEIMRNMITELQNDPNVSIESLGEKEIDGRMAQGFRAADPEGNELMIWADSQTSLPIRMEQKWRQIHYEFMDFEFDVVLDESLFSMDIPAGYSTMPNTMLSLTGAEQDLVEALRQWAESILEGVFPKDFSSQAFMDDMPKVRKRIAQDRKEGKDEGPMKMIRGFMFYKNLKPENDWHYVGKDVKFGDAESPVCWYKPTGSQTYRVIYGDLTVKDVAPEDLPE
jgi:outer membrane lipoprotein-sorting protein